MPKNKGGERMATNFIDMSTKHAVAGSSKLKATTAGHIYNILTDQF